MQRQRHAGLILLLVGSMLAACAGGSGSSGFDVRPEDAAIHEALAAGHCVQHESLAICPASETSTSPSQPAQQIAINIAPGASLPCMVSAQDDTCGFTMPFSTSGFPPTATFHSALRTINPSSRWVIGAALAPISDSAPSSFDAPVSLSDHLSPSQAAISVQAAVLVFFTPPVNPPTEVDELVDSGAEAAYVTDPFTLQPE